MISVGLDCYVNEKEVETISGPESAPVRRMISEAKDKSLCVDLTFGRSTKSVIVLKSGKVVLSAVLPSTISKKISQG